MKRELNVDQVLDSWFTEGPTDLPDRTVAAIVEGLDDVRQRGPHGLPSRLSMPRFVPALAGAAVVLAVAVVALGVFLNRPGVAVSPSTTPSPSLAPEESAHASPTRPSPTPQQSSGLGIFEPVAGRIVYEDGDGISAVDPAAADSADAIRLSNEPGDPLGWTSDGTQLLIKRDVDLFVLHADGTETQVTEGLFGFRGATISPDGSRVAFAAGNPTAEGDCCSSSALFMVSADGGAPEKLLDSQLGILEYPAFSTDGTKIVYDDGAGDHGHSVWLVNADGSDAHQIVSTEIDGAGHVYALAWSLAGDRIALNYEGYIYTFAPDGSELTQIAGDDGTCVSLESCAVSLPKTAISPFWSPDGSQIAYETGCTDGAGMANEDGCFLAIANADGSNVRKISGARPGPWHPGTPFAEAPRPTGLDASPAATELAETPSPTRPVSVDLGVFGPVAGRIVYEYGNGILAVDPAAADSGDAIRLSNEPGGPRGWTSDGTELLVHRDVRLLVLHADGTETEVPGGSGLFATISPDGSRVVYTGQTDIPPDGTEYCANGAVFSVDAGGGPAQVIWESQAGMVRDPTFSPDGTRIAVVDGFCDSDHSVWVMNADGSDAHQIVAGEIGRAGHGRGLAWSPAGDRIALGFEGYIYTFAPDGSGFTQIAGAEPSCSPYLDCATKQAISPYWSPDGSQIAYETGCTEGAGFVNEDGCLLAIANADGSNVRKITGARPGPWHPGTLSPSIGSVIGLK
jgi:Tol biopolymer transport system component